MTDAPEDIYRALRIDSTGQELQVAKFTKLHLTASFLGFEEISPGKWRLECTADLITETQRLQSIQVTLDEGRKDTGKIVIRADDSEGKQSRRELLDVKIVRTTSKIPSLNMQHSSRGWKLIASDLFGSQIAGGLTLTVVRRD